MSRMEQQRRAILDVLKRGEATRLELQEATLAGNLTARISECRVLVQAHGYALRKTYGPDKAGETRYALFAPGGEMVGRPLGSGVGSPGPPQDRRESGRRPPSAGQDPRLSQGRPGAPCSNCNPDGGAAVFCSRGCREAYREQLDGEVRVARAS